MCKHQLKRLRQSMILVKGKPLEIEVWQCQVCKKFIIVDLKRDSKISLNGELGEEIE